MSDPTDEAFKNRCVVCGERVPMASASSPGMCQICGGLVCPTCLGRLVLHHMKYDGTIRVCPNCSSRLQDKGNKPINPFQFLGGY